MRRYATSGKIALAAGVLLGIVRARWAIIQFQALVRLPDLRWTNVASCLANWLLLAPLPIMLVMLYQSGGAVRPSARLRYGALATALVLGLFFAAPGLLMLLAELARVLGRLQSYGDATVAGNLLIWLKTPEAREHIGSWLFVSSQGAVVCFLLALFLSGNAAGEVPPRVTKAAAVAALAGAITVALNIVGQVNGAIHFQPDWYFGPTRSQFLVRNAVNGVLEVCRAAVPALVWRSATAWLPSGSGNTVPLEPSCLGENVAPGE